MSRDIQEDLKPRISRLPRAPGLAVILAGDNPASQIHVRSKIWTCRELGIRSFDAAPPESISTAELVDMVERFNADPDVEESWSRHRCRNMPTRRAFCKRYTRRKMRTDSTGATEPSDSVRLPAFWNLEALRYCDRRPPRCCGNMQRSRRQTHGSHAAA
ncbi:MAG TPA: tetrahydrofolate dehydrogenase/cyclohydrolase catalytic domain-containing protein [Terriglobales bacterium]|nr:tetrahydrofolate dehydrogenase/cyclohydrolase catalytic domain-containing protein [Terriglobales bacterium]